MPSSNQNLSQMQGRYWMLTIPSSDFLPSETVINETILYIKGQKETGESTGYEHWQVMVVSKKCRGTKIKQLFGRTTHVELSRSQAAETYVWKAETRVENSQFEFGQKPFKRNSKTDWKKVKDDAISGNISQIAEENPQVFIQSYKTLKQIAIDYAVCPPDLEGPCGIWLYGAPGVGKSYAVREKFGDSLFIKPQSKWWDGYKNEQHVLLDDFDCKVMGHYLKIWSDAYKFSAESKNCTSREIRPKTIIITSNYRIGELFEDPMEYAAIARRFRFIEMRSREDAQLI